MYVRHRKALVLLVLGLITASAAQKPADVELVRAIRAGNAKSVQTLLAKGADANAREVLSTKPSVSTGEAGGKPVKGDTALIIAVDRQDMAIAKLLLGRGADPNGKGQAGFTPLMRAAQDSLALVKLLLDRGAKPDVRNDYGDTAIVFAANVGDVRIIDLLLLRKANIDGGTRWTPLMEAAYNGNFDAAKFLLRRKADPNLRRPGLMTALECAIAQGNDEIAALIRNAGGKGKSSGEMQSEGSAEADAERKRREKAAHELAVRHAADRVVTTDDREIIEAVLLDMLASRGSGLYSFANGGQIGLLESTEVFDEFAENQMNSELSEREALDVTLALRRSLIERNSEPVSLRGFKPLSPKITLVKDSYGLLGKERNGWVRIALPGRSADGRWAAVRFSFGPTAHGAAGTCLLERAANRWLVVWRRFSYYA